MKKILLDYIPKSSSPSKFIFTALLLLLSIFNRQTSFAAGQNVIGTDGINQHRINHAYGTNKYDESRSFDRLVNNYQIPHNIGLVKKHKSVLVIGKMNAGKTTLVNRFGGFSHDTKGQEERIEECKDTEEQPIKNIAGTVGNGGQRLSCTKMPNIIFNSKHSLAFVDCPGFNDETEKQRAFIKASVQIVISKIQTLKAILCVIDKEGFEKTIDSLEGAEDHPLRHLVIYLQQVLKEPLDFCRWSLVLVVNNKKEDGEYTAEQAQKTLKDHRTALERFNYRFARNPVKWKENGADLLRFVNIFLQDTDNQKKIICISRVKEQNNFDEALTKISAINTEIRNYQIKIAFSKQDQKKFIALILKSTVPLRELTSAYNTDMECAQEKTPSLSVVPFIIGGLVIAIVMAVMINNKENKSSMELLGGCFILTILGLLCYLFDSHQKNMPLTSKTKKRLVNLYAKQKGKW